MRASATSASRASIAPRSVSGAAMSSHSRRRPAALWQRSISPSRLPAMPPLAERVSSRLSRVAASIAIWPTARNSARRVEQDARRPSGSRRDRRAARPRRPVRRATATPRPSSVARPKRRLSARSPARLSNPPLPAPCVECPGTGVVGDHFGRRRSAPVRRRARRGRRRPARTGRSRCRRRRSPNPRPRARSPRASWPTPASSKASSVSVPGVTRRTMARSTSAFDPRALRASAGLSICSAMATRWPPLISRAR